MTESFIDIYNNILAYNKNEISIIIDKDGNPWFAGRNIAAALGYVNQAKAIREHVKQKHKTNLKNLAHYLNKIPLNAQFHSVYINEAGLFSLILSSKKKEAEIFQDWVTEEVLPSIRKYGNYVIENKHKEKISKIKQKNKGFERNS